MKYHNFMIISFFNLTNYIPKNILSAEHLIHRPCTYVELNYVFKFQPILLICCQYCLSGTFLWFTHGTGCAPSPALSTLCLSCFSPFFGTFLGYSVQIYVCSVNLRCINILIDSLYMYINIVSVLVLSLLWNVSRQFHFFRQLI